MFRWLRPPNILQCIHANDFWHHIAYLASKASKLYPRLLRGKQSKPLNVMFATPEKKGDENVWHIWRCSSTNNLFKSQGVWRCFWAVTCCRCHNSSVKVANPTKARLRNKLFSNTKKFSHQITKNHQKGKHQQHFHQSFSHQKPSNS